MGKIARNGWILGRGILSSILIFCLVAGPVAPSAYALDQTAAQNSTSSTNSQAQQLSQLMAILSMAAGGLYMAKGAQELACCSTGCNTGAGKSSVDTQKAIDLKAKDGAANLPKPGAWNLVPLPAGCTTRPAAGQLSLLFNLFQPQPVRASGCMDALLSLLTGGLMMLQGIMGMMAANQAGQNALGSGLNSTGMNTLNTSTGTSTATAQNPNATSLGAGSNPNPIKIDPSLLRTGTANSVLGDFEKKFGIPRDQFANSVAAGADPRDLLMKAPQNALSAEDINKAMSGAKGMSPAAQADALSKTGLADLQKELTANSKMGDDANAYNTGAGGGTRAPAAKPKSLLDDVAATDGAVNPDTLGLSPEVANALNAQALAAAEKPAGELTIFDVVRRKYRERTSMIFGGKAPGKPGSGVANEDGM